MINRATLYCPSYGTIVFRSVVMAGSGCKAGVSLRPLAPRLKPHGYVTGACAAVKTTSTGMENCVAQCRLQPVAPLRRVAIIFVLLFNKPCIKARASSVRHKAHCLGTRGRAHQHLRVHAQHGDTAGVHVGVRTEACVDVHIKQVCGRAHRRARRQMCMQTHACSGVRADEPSGGSFSWYHCTQPTDRSI